MPHFQERRSGGDRRHHQDRKTGKDRRGNIGANVEFIEGSRFKAWIEDHKNSSS